MHFARIPIIIVLLFVSETGKVDPTPHTSSFNMGYLVSPYPYPNGAGAPIPVSMVSSPVMLFLVLFPSKIWHASDLPPVCPSYRLSCSRRQRRVRSASFVRTLIWLRQTVSCLPSRIVITLLIYDVRKLDSRFIFTAALAHARILSLSLFLGLEFAPRANGRSRCLFKSSEKI